MSLQQYLAILVKRWKLIVICFVLVGLGAYVGSKLLTPLYQSTALVQITIHSGNNQADYNSLLASDQLVQTEAQLATSDPVLREVASHYPGLTAEQLAKEVSSTNKPNTQLFVITVQDSSPTRAAALANDIAATLIKQQLQAIQQDNGQSRQQIQQDLVSTGKQINTLTNHIAALKAQEGSQAQIGVLEAQLAGLQQHYNQWQAALAQLELTEAESGNFLRIAQAAYPTLRPVQPNTLLNTGAGLLTGLFVGLLLAVLLEQLDTLVRTPEALTELLGWSILATIWKARPKEDVVNPTGNNINSESYRILRTNIGFSGIDKPLRSLMITSTMPRDGKSVIAANLAIFMAKVGKTTLLIDADLRRPSVHELFGLSVDKAGLSNAVLAFSMSTPANTPSYDHFFSPTSPTQPTSTPTTTSALQSSVPTMTIKSLSSFVHSVDIPNLWVMPSGPLPPNPPELLDSMAMQDLLKVIVNCGFEVVIFDTPPLLGLSDSSILASKVDGALFVVDITRANKKNLKQAKVLLGQAGARVLGCVVNKRRRSRHDKTSSYYYYYRTGEQNGEANHSAENMNSPLSPLPIPANIFKQTEMWNGKGNQSPEHTNPPTVPLNVFKQPEA